MGAEFRSIEECLLRLQSVDSSYIVRVYIGESGPEYDILTNSESKLVPLHRLRGVQSIIKYVLESVKDESQAYFGYNPQLEGEVYSFGERASVGLVYFGKFTILKRPGRGRPLPTLEFESGAVCSSYTDYLDFFGLVDTYTNRGKIMSWVNSHLEQADEGEEKTYVFDPRRVKGFTKSMTRFKTEIYVLSYRGLPDMFGFGAIVKTFPDITLQQVEELYTSNGLKVPSTAKKHYRDKKKTTPQAKPKKVSANKDFSYYLDTYGLQESKTTGYLNFRASYGDVVINSPKKLAEELRNHGEVITQNEAKELWDSVMGGGE